MDSQTEALQALLEGLQSGELRLQLADLPFPPDEWKSWQNHRCGRWMRDWLARTQIANNQRLKTEAGIALYRAQGASEVLDCLEGLLAEQTDPERGVATEETDDAGDA